MKNTKKEKHEMLLDLGIMIRKLRLKKGFKSAELFSYENNLNRTAYWRWENGQNITMKNFFKICSIHQLTPREFFDMLDKKSTDKNMLIYLNENQEDYKNHNSEKDSNN